LILPDPVNAKRFFALEFVFIFGMFSLLKILGNEDSAFLLNHNICVNLLIACASVIIDVFWFN
jgi:hypothetical protein